MTLHRREALAALTAPLAGLLVLPQFGCAHSGEDPALRNAIAGTHRSEANRARDGARHPYETLKFIGVRATDKVIELSPGGGWYTEILAPYLRERGQLFVAHFPADDASAGRRRARQSFEAKLAQAPALYDKARVGSMPSNGAFSDIAPDGGADVVLTFRNIHNWIADGQLDLHLKAVARVLKPGGVLGVEEHRAKPGTSLEGMKSSGYVTEDYMIERARAAGLELQARSEVNANPRDTKDHPGGVWALPPTLRHGATDREKYLAIGESDRFTHRYIKRA